MAETSSTVHEPHCNTECRPGWHYLSSGVGMVHLHRTDLGAECGQCHQAVVTSDDD